MSHRRRQETPAAHGAELERVRNRWNEAVNAGRAARPGSPEWTEARVLERHVAAEYIRELKEPHQRGLQPWGHATGSPRTRSTGAIVSMALKRRLTPNRRPSGAPSVAALHRDLAGVLPDRQRIALWSRFAGGW